MHTQSSSRFLPACLLAVFLLTAGFEPAFAQSKLQENPGGYHGELDFPINWKQYYSYEEWTGIMHDIQREYDHLADIESIGRGGCTCAGAYSPNSCDAATDANCDSCGGASSRQMAAGTPSARLRRRASSASSRRPVYSRASARCILASGLSGASSTAPRKTRRPRSLLPRPNWVPTFCFGLEWLWSA